MTQLDAFGRDYLRLVLEIHAHHIDGYVDAYVGPAELKAEVDAAPPQTPADLLAAVADLQERIPEGDPTRAAYLAAALRGIDCTVRMLNGRTFDYLDEVHRIYDIRPELVAEARFEEAHRQLDQVLPTGEGDLPGRLLAYHQAFEIDAARALPLLELARAETRRRTAALFALPDDESVEVRLSLIHI